MQSASHRKTEIECRNPASILLHFRHPASLRTPAQVSMIHAVYLCLVPRVLHSAGFGGSREYRNNPHLHTISLANPRSSDKEVQHPLPLCRLHVNAQTRYKVTPSGPFIALSRKLPACPTCIRFPLRPLAVRPNTQSLIIADYSEVVGFDLDFDSLRTLRACGFLGWY